MKLNRVLKVTKESMQVIAIQWNPKKCNVMNVKKGVQVYDSRGFKVGEKLPSICLRENSHIDFYEPRIGSYRKRSWRKKKQQRCTSK